MFSEREFLEVADCVALRKTSYQACFEKLVRSLLTTCELSETPMKAMYDFANARQSFPDYTEKLDGIAKWTPTTSPMIPRGSSPQRRAKHGIKRQDARRPL